jgi:2-C-methyl-D-erythritol 2,4-cyclodiphosphate synthase
MRSKIAAILEINHENVGITATSGEGLTLFGQGKGIQAFVIATVVK